MNTRLKLFLKPIHPFNLELSAIRAISTIRGRHARQFTLRSRGLERGFDKVRIDTRDWLRVTIIITTVFCRLPFADSNFVIVNQGDVVRLVGLFGQIVEA